MLSHCYMTVEKNLLILLGVKIALWVCWKRSLFWEMCDGLFKDKMSPWFIKNINR